MRVEMVLVIGKRDGGVNKRDGRWKFRRNNNATFGHGQIAYIWTYFSDHLKVSPSFSIRQHAPHGHPEGDLCRWLVARLIA
jgi:hypothetical protein